MNALSVNGLTKIYPNGTCALKGINLEVAQGDFFALLGQNGAGKSTTISIICSLVNKTAGSISVFGHDYRSRLGLVFALFIVMFFFAWMLLNKGIGIKV